MRRLLAMTVVLAAAGEARAQYGCSGGGYSYGPPGGFTYSAPSGYAPRPILRLRLDVGGQRVVNFSAPLSREYYAGPAAYGYGGGYCPPAYYGGGFSYGPPPVTYGYGNGYGNGYGYNGYGYNGGFQRSLVVRGPQGGELGLSTGYGYGGYGGGYGPPPALYGGGGPPRIYENGALLSQPFGRN
jgi:hypothetical protein